VAIDQSKVKDELERARLSRIFEQGLESPVGSVLPIMREYNGRGRWRSGPWFLRSEKCYLIPGDSPIGYRLPLDSLPWAAPTDPGFISEPDPMISHPALPPLDAFRRAPVLRRQERSAAANGEESARREAWKQALELVPARGASAGWIVRT